MRICTLISFSVFFSPVDRRQTPQPFFHQGLSAFSNIGWESDSARDRAPDNLQPCFCDVFVLFIFSCSHRFAPTVHLYTHEEIVDASACLFFAPVRGR